MNKGMNKPDGCEPWPPLPAVSVILPVRDRADVLRTAVESILQQTFRNFELILVDDASSDQTPDVICSLSDPRIVVVRNERPRGAAGARNAGLKLARAPLIAFHDSDDTCRPDKLQRQWEIFQSAGPEVGVVYTRYLREGDGRLYVRPPESAPTTSGDLFDALLSGNLVGMPTALIRRELFDRCGGFDESLQVLVDWELFLRMARVCRFRFIPDVLYFSRVRADSVSVRHEAYARAFIRILKQFSADFERRPCLLARHYGTIAHRFYCAGLKAEGRRYYLCAARLRPFHAPYWAGWGLSFMGLSVYKAVVRFRGRFKESGHEPCGQRMNTMMNSGHPHQPGAHPRVSVVIPTYNRARSIRRSIESVLQQTFQDFEILVVDDGSTDDTAQVVAGIGDSRIHYHRQAVNGGAGAARNAGLLLARGEWVAFQDSDDLWRPEKLALQMARFEAAEERLGVVYCGFIRIEQGRERYSPPPKIVQREGNIHAELLKGNFVTTQAAVVRRECFSTVGLFDQSLQPLEDWDLFLRLSKAYPFGIVDEPLVISEIGADSISAQTERYLHSLRGVVEKHAEDFARHKNLAAGHWNHLGDGLCRMGRRREGAGAFARAARLQPWHLQHWAGLLLSLAGTRAYAQISDRGLRWTGKKPFST